MSSGRRRGTIRPAAMGGGKTSRHVGSQAVLMLCLAMLELGCTEMDATGCHPIRKYALSRTDVSASGGDTAASSETELWLAQGYGKFEVGNTAPMPYVIDAWQRALLWFDDCEAQGADTAFIDIEDWCGGAFDDNPRSERCVFRQAWTRAENGEPDDVIPDSEIDWENMNLDILDGIMTITYDRDGLSVQASYAMSAYTP